MRVIATDLDRTLIPNGHHSLSKGSMEIFRKELRRSGTRLVYVTGRNRRLILEGIQRYKLPKPDYCVAMVGTEIFKYKNGRLVDVAGWDKVLARDWKNIRRERIAELLNGFKELREQEKSKLNEFKESYYVSLSVDKNDLISRVERVLKKNKVSALVIYSVDPRRKIGLLDVLPKNGIKDEALSFVLKLMSVRRSDVLYAGDSGNDIKAIVSGYKTVLVKNAPDWVKREVKRKVKMGGLRDKVYLAEGGFIGLNGNYVSGIIEGAYHFGFFG